MISLKLNTSQTNRLADPLSKAQRVAFAPLKFSGPLTKKTDKEDPYSSIKARKPVKLAERGARFLEFQLRKLGMKWAMRKEDTKEFIQGASSFLDNIDERDPQFLLAVGQMCGMLSQQIETEINLESGILDDIVNSDEACIFIMNHDNQRYDPALMATFNMELYKKYMEAGKIVTAPRPKVIINEDILLPQSEELRNIYTQLGAVGVDANIANTDNAGRKNLKTLLPVIRGFNNDEYHTFIFPEGRKSAFREGLTSKVTGVNLKSKFQTGVGDIIYAAAKKKKRVKVVPLGLAARTKTKPGLKRPKKWTKPLGSIVMGAPIYFTLEDGQMHASQGGITPMNAFDGLKKFFWENPVDRFIHGDDNPSKPKYIEKDDTQYRTLTLNGEPVKGRKLNAQVISGILYANLKLCKDEAIETLPKKPSEEFLEKETKEKK